MQRNKWFMESSSPATFGAKEPELNMFCFPFAGGGASIYRTWNKGFQPLAHVLPVQLPGREERIREARYYSIIRLVDAFFEEEESHGWFNSPCVLFGHSMGAKIAFEVARRLEQQGRAPSLLMVSGSRPPFMPSIRHISNLGDKAFDEELRHLAGTPEEILREKDLMKMFRPLLRADFAMDESYEHSAKLSIPICVFAGDEDTEVSPLELDAWQRHTTSTFSSHILRGDHFFLKQIEHEFITLLRKQIETTLGTNV